MEKLKTYAANLQGLFFRFAELGAAFVFAVIVVYLLLGNSAGPYVVSVVENVSTFVQMVTPAAFVALAVILALIYLIRKPK
jgi:Na+-translocating ferredoxin:NAD+ oxidoreductase RnfE subunit